MTFCLGWCETLVNLLPYIVLALFLVAVVTVFKSFMDKED